MYRYGIIVYKHIIPCLICTCNHLPEDGPSGLKHVGDIIKIEILV